MTEDLLLLLGDHTRTADTRFPGSHWTPLSEQGASSSYLGSSSGQWRGFPLHRLEAGHFEIVLLGELFGGTDRFMGGVVAGELSCTVLNGHFLLVAFDRSAHEWHVFTDRFGTLHAYVADAPNGIAISTSFAAATSMLVDRELDWLGINGFFTTGFFPEDRTYFTKVRLFEPAMHYVFNQRGETVASSRYWEWWHEPDTSRSYDETVDAFADTITQVMTDQLGDHRTAIPISGGLDSRTTVAAGVPASDRLVSNNLWAYSYGFGRNSPELPIARAVAQTRNLTFAEYVVEPYLFDRLDLVLGCTEGFQDVTQARQATIVGKMAQRADRVIAAHWGDVWLDDMGLVGREDASPAEVTEHTWKKQVKRGHGWLVDNVAAPVVGRDWLPALRDSMAARLDALQRIQDPDFRVKAFKTDGWSLRWTTASLRMFQPGAFPRLPFYDSRIGDLFCTVPSSMLGGRRLQIDYLKRHATDLARVRWQKTGNDLFKPQRSTPWKVPERALKKVWRTASRRRILERNWEVQFHSRSGRAGLEKYLVRRGARLHEFVGPDAVVELLRNLDQKPHDPEVGYAVSMLLTFSAALERYA
jgi:asparagine synthase (glutamine-hydrolysing)